MTHQENKGACEVCREVAKQLCASCKAVYYCSRECQKKGWKDHKNKCRPFTIQTNQKYGRYIVATRDIKPGEIIIKEKPIIVGPKQTSQPVCLGCHKPPSGVKCPTCSYLLCNIHCNKNHKEECTLLSRRKGSVCEEDEYSAIMALRCLLTKKSNPKVWEAINSMQDHLREIKKGDLNDFFKTRVVKFLRENLKLEEYDEEIILKICGILTTNSFEIKENGSRVRGLYSTASKMAHSCVPNTKHVIEDDLTAVFYSTTKINKGASITATYTQILWNTLARRQNLKMMKFFLCSCPRCSDPTELGTQYSSLLCSKCGGSILAKDPLDEKSPWICSKCSYSMSSKQVKWGDAVLFKELRELDKSSSRQLEEFLEKYKNALHQQNRFFTEAKYALVRMYGNLPTCRYRGGNVNLSRQQLEDKVKWCRELLTLAEVIDPGLSLFRGSMLFELQAGLVALAKWLLSNELITNDGAKKYMKEAAEVLKEATLILNHEPDMRDGGLSHRLAQLSEELDM